MSDQRPSINDLVIPPNRWQELVIVMSEGNPGAMRVLMEILRYAELAPIPFPRAVLDLDDMNIRGQQIWVAYKNACHENLEELLSKCASRDEAMVETVNRESQSEWLAVVSGASAPGARRRS